MKLKLIATLVFFVAFISTNVNARPTIGLEFNLGFGKSAKSSGNSSKWCKNRSWSSLKGFGVYASDDNVELHVSKYSHDVDARNCDRSTWVIGVGPKVSTKKDGEQKDVYAEWSPGIAYRLNKTWRDQSNFSVYNRFRLGVAVDRNTERQTSLEVGVLQYGGFFEPNHGESLFTFGISTNDIDNHVNNSTEEQTNDTTNSDTNNGTNDSNNNSSSNDNDSGSDSTGGEDSNKGDDEENNNSSSNTGSHNHNHGHNHKNVKNNKHNHKHGHKYGHYHNGKKKINNLFKNFFNGKI